MPIYRVPAVTSSLPFQKLSSSQDVCRQDHQHPQHQYVDHHSSQPKHHMQHQQQLDPNENVVRRSLSIPTQTPVANHSTPPERVGMIPEDESIVEREIRLQLEREAEIALLHGEQQRRRRSTSNRNPHGDSTSAAEETMTMHSGEVRREGKGSSSRASTGDLDEGRKVIHQYSKVGESLIVKELLEQKRREEEVRNHSTNIGMLADGRRRSSAEGERPIAPVPTSNIRAVLRVQPFEDPEDESSDSRQAFITPQTETVIEREIRLQRQREGSLRRARGYPLQAREDRLREVDIHPAAVRPGHPGEQRGLQSRRTFDGESSSDGSSMQRLATNRLRQEIQRERQREMDLRRQGTIYTISEERHGLEPEPLSPNSQDSMDSGAAAAGGARRSSGRDDPTGSHREPAYLHQPNDFYGGDSDRSASEHHAVVEKRPLEKLPSWRTAAELRIEEEVKEARRREKELREQRRLANATLQSQMEQQQQQQQQPMQHQQQPMQHQQQPMQHQQNLSTQQQSKQFYRRT